MSDGFWRGWYWANFWNDAERNAERLRKVEVGSAPIDPVNLLAVPMLFFLAIEVLLFGGLAFHFITGSPTDMGMSLPAWLGWVGAIVVGLLYLGLSGWWPGALVLTAFWTPVWALLFHKADVNTFEPLNFVASLVRHGWSATAPMVEGHSWTWALVTGAVVFFGRIAFVIGASRR
jgi:hypothetical protein